MQLYSRDWKEGEIHGVYVYMLLILLQLRSLQLFRMTFNAGFRTPAKQSLNTRSLPWILCPQKKTNYITEKKIKSKGRDKEENKIKIKERTKIKDITERNNVPEKWISLNSNNVSFQLEHFILCDFSSSLAFILVCFYTDRSWQRHESVFPPYDEKVGFSCNALCAELLTEFNSSLESDKNVNFIILHRTICSLSCILSNSDFSHHPDSC